MTITYLPDNGHGLLDIGGLWHRQSGKTKRTPSPCCNEHMQGPLRYRPLTEQVLAGDRLCAVCFRPARDKR